MAKELEKYINSDFVKSCYFDQDTGCYCYIERGVRQRCGGLLNVLARQFYPNYTYRGSRGQSWKRAKKGSDKKIGKRIDAEIEKYITQDKKPLHKMSTVLIDYWEKEKHTLLAAQVPVKVKQFGIVTEADVITQDCNGKLWMWEVKTGYPANYKQKNRYLRKIDTKVTNTRLNHWELQRHFTAEALIEAGVPIYASRVINVYEKYVKTERKKILNIRARKPPTWTKKIQVGKKRKR